MIDDQYLEVYRREAYTYKAAYEDSLQRIAALEAALKGLYSECCYAGFDTAKDYAWPGVMKQAKEALTPSETEAK